MSAILETGTIRKSRVAKLETIKTVEAKGGEALTIPYSMKFLDESYLGQVFRF